MIDSEIEKDASLLRCTLKKSWSVLWKVLKYGTYLILGILAIYFAYYGAFAIYEMIAPGLASVWQFVITVPWYVYGGIVAVAAIPVYSVLWCIARDLTEEDWKSGAADNFASALAAFALAALALAALAFAFALAALALAALALAAFALAFALAALAAFALALALALAGDDTSIWYYIFRFPGAVYHHYRIKERMKGIENMPILEKEE